MQTGIIDQIDAHAGFFHEFLDATVAILTQEQHDAGVGQQP